uniref:Solute carrier family 29 member 1 (Augustine blood group) n=1 Tax=Takifugu rubripes TaxID=31033 RepID=A0A674PIA8_TAKRU
MLGLGTLLPWNFFMTAIMESSLGDTLANQTQAAGEDRSILEAKFNNLMTFFAMLPLLCTCLNSILHSLIVFKCWAALLSSCLFFIITAIIVKVPLEPLTFFCLTMVKIVIINSFGAVLQGSLFGMAGLLPASYTTLIMSGQGLAGSFAAFAMICAIASGSDLHDSAFGSFITACTVIFMCILSYVVLPKLEYFQEVKKIDNCSTDQTKRQKISVVKIFKKVCLECIFQMNIFPIFCQLKFTKNDQYFVPVSCFLLFNLCDWGGRSLTALCMWSRKDSLLLPGMIECHVIFIPLFMLCNVQPHLHLPVLFYHDAFFILFMILFAFSNGYLASLCMFLPHEAETAGTIMAFFLSLGLALGAALLSEHLFNWENYSGYFGKNPKKQKNLL